MFIHGNMESSCFWVVFLVWKIWFLNLWFTHVNIWMLHLICSWNEMVWPVLIEGWIEAREILFRCWRLVVREGRRTGFVWEGHLGIVCPFSLCFVLFKPLPSLNGTLEQKYLFNHEIEEDFSRTFVCELPRNLFWILLESRGTLRDFKCRTTSEASNYHYSTTFGLLVYTETALGKPFQHN